MYGVLSQSDDSRTKDNEMVQGILTSQDRDFQNINDSVE